MFPLSFKFIHIHITQHHIILPLIDQLFSTGPFSPIGQYGTGFFITKILKHVLILGKVYFPSLILRLRRKSLSLHINVALFIMFPKRNPIEILKGISLNL